MSPTFINSTQGLCGEIAAGGNEGLEVTAVSDTDAETSRAAVGSES